MLKKEDNFDKLKRKKVQERKTFPNSCLGITFLFVFFMNLPNSYAKICRIG